MQTMTCKNCCAPINPHLDHCEYCGGYFERPSEEILLKKEIENIKHEARVKQLYEAALQSMRDYGGRIMTPNEMRATMGLDPFTDEQIIPLERNCEMMFDDVSQQYVIKKPLKPKKKLFGFGR